MVTTAPPFVLGLIPARGGSKRLPGKNIRPLAGRPLIGWTISAAKAAKRLNDVLVSTDDPAIRDVALSFGAQAPFLRPTELAQDETSSEDVVKHAVLEYERLWNVSVDGVVLLQPTSPFTTPTMIDTCVSKAFVEKKDCVITVAIVSKRCEWIGVVDKSDVFQLILDADTAQRLQRNLEYSPSGNVYVLSRKAVFDERRIIDMAPGVVPIAAELAVDIDTLTDFLFAEFLLKEKVVTQV